jgi:hypothetical protein
MFTLISGLIRHAMTFGGGFLIDKDYTTLTEWDGAVAAVVTLAGIAWSIYEKKKAA